MSRLAINANQVGQILTHSYLTLATRVALGGVFIFAGVAKLGQLAEFQDLVEAYDVLPVSLSRIYGLILPGVEVALGVLLVTGLLLRISSFLSILITLSFVIGKSVNLYRGVHLTCGCFGETAVTLSSQSLALDIVLLAMAFQILFHRGDFLALGPWLSQKAAEAEGE
ncbi:MAG: DoxX family membrane protein [Chloroflexi bacterium]|jgi:uncharacterized membrane protein YphA (DoxX/SURF4 family)|nr:DoxX family membrane protein [Chloroflexota bacterium]